jgi:hypothetical protein
MTHLCVFWGGKSITILGAQRPQVDVQEHVDMIADRSGRPPTDRRVTVPTIVAEITRKQDLAILDLARIKEVVELAP